MTDGAHELARQDPERHVRQRGHVAPVVHEAHPAQLNLEPAKLGPLLVEPGYQLHLPSGPPNLELRPGGVQNLELLEPLLDLARAAHDAGPLDPYVPRSLLDDAQLGEVA